MSSDSEVSEGQFDDDSESDNRSNVKSQSGKATALNESEKKLIMDLIVQNKNVIEETSKSLEATDRKRKIWDNIEVEFCKGGTTKRTAFQLRTWWSNTKKRSKRKQTKAKLKRLAAIQRKRGYAKIPDLKLGDTIKTEADLEEHNSDVSERLVENGHSSDLADMDLDEDGANEECLNESGINSQKSDMKKYADVRSLLIDLEYEEHKVRMKTLLVQYEEAELGKSLAKKKLEFQEKEHVIQMKILQAQLNQYSAISLKPS